MNQIGRNLYSNFNPSQLIPISERKVRALIMGSCGSGKTRFINNLCQTNHLVKNAKGSVTRDIVYEDVFYVQKGAFRIYDTPGTDSSKEALQHALVLRASLTNLPLNLIMINVKLDCRFQRTLTQISGLLKIFSMYKPMVVILISHLDIILKEKQKQSIINELFTDLKQINTSIKAIFYSNTDSDFQTLSLTLFKIGKCIEPKLLTIQDKNFYKHFHLSCPESKMMNEEITDYLEEIKQSAKIIIDFVEPLNRATNSDLEQLLTNLKLYAKYQLKLVQYKQYQKYSTKFENQFITTDVYLMMSQFIQSKLEQLDDLCELKTGNKKVYYDTYYKKNIDVRQLFKKCPHCGLIWMRVQGCAEDTTCGYKSYYYDYEKDRDLKDYQFYIVDDKLVYKKKSQKKISQIIQEQKITQNQFFNFNQNTQEVKIGCNGLIQWGKLPLIPGIDQKLKEMYGVANVQQLELQLNGLKVKHKSFKQQLDQKIQNSIRILKEDKMILQEKVKEQEKEQKLDKK